MASVIERLRKRRFYPVTIDGETVHVRAMLDSEMREVMQFREEEESVGFAIGCGLLNDDGSPVITIGTDETPKQFGARVLRELNLPTDTRAELSNKILQLSQGPPDDKREAIVKN